MDLPEEIHWPVKHYTVNIILHPKHKQPDGVWFFTDPDGLIKFSNIRNICVHFLNYNDAMTFVKENTFITASIKHPTNKQFKL